MSGRERPVWLVAKREIREATRATAFRVTLIISAVALAAIIVIANLGGSGTDTQDVVVAGPGRRRAGSPASSSSARPPASTVRVTAVPDDATARAAVDDEQADVAVSADGTELTTREPVDLGGDSKLATLLNVLRPSLALDNGLRAAGLTPRAGRRGARHAAAAGHVGARPRIPTRSTPARSPRRRSPTSCCSSCCRPTGSGSCRA